MARGAAEHAPKHHRFIGDNGNANYTNPRLNKFAGFAEFASPSKSHAKYTQGTAQKRKPKVSSTWLRVFFTWVAPGVTNITSWLAEVTM